MAGSRTVVYRPSSGGDTFTAPGRGHGRAVKSLVMYVIYIPYFHPAVDALIDRDEGEVGRSCTARHGLAIICVAISNKFGVFLVGTVDSEGLDGL